MLIVLCSGQRGRGGVSQHALDGGLCIQACTGQGGVYPSMHWAARVCIPACTGQGGCVSHHALGRGVCIPACTRQGCVRPSMHWAWGVYHSMHWAVGCLTRGVSAQRDVWPGGSLPGGVCPGSLPRGFLPGGCLPSGVSAPPHTHLGRHPPQTETQTPVKT